MVYSHHSRKGFFVAVGLMLALSVSVQAYIAPAAPGESVGCYVSTGDNDNLFYAPPVDSIAAVDAYFDILDRVYGVNKVYWRAMQADQATLYSEVSPYNFFSTNYEQWEHYLNQVVGTGYHGVKAAHERGMEIWGIAALLDHGIQDQVDAGKGFGPGHWQYKVRIEHPEWIPVDKYGIRRMAGPLCFAYPWARQAMIDMYEDLALRAGYDGVLFFLYVENFQARNADEFCYNDVLVEAYKERYGIDIKKEPVDVYAMARLRGEYLTQFFRELRERLEHQGVKVGLCLSAIWPDYPQPWLYRPDLMVGGRVLLDWRTYIKESLVDELHVYAGGTPYELVNTLLRETEGTAVEVSMMSSAAHPDQYRHFIEQGVTRVIYGGYDSITEGYLEPQPVEALGGDDYLAKLNVLTQMGNEKIIPDTVKILHALNDEHLLVRRQALWAIGKLKLDEAKVKAAVEEALNDPENAVCCYAVDTLTKIGDADSIRKIYDCLSEHHNFMIHLAAAWGLAKLPEARNDELIIGLNHTSAPVRRVAVEACCSSNYRYGLVENLTELTDDEDDEVRWLIARALTRHAVEAAVPGLLELVNDEHPTVRNMAAKGLAGYCRSNTRWIGPFQHKVLRLFTEKFSTYNSTYKGVDADWGWRCFGNGLKACGPRGEEVLEALLAQDEDPVLGDIAWQTLTIEQDGMHFYPKPMDIIMQEYLRHPKVRTTVPPMPVRQAEPAMMPYIVQDFEAEGFAPGVTGEAGDLLSHSGYWRRLGVAAPEPRIVEANYTGSDGNVLCLSGAEGKNLYADAVRTDYRVSEGTITIACDVYLQANSQLTVWLTDSGVWGGNLKVVLSPENELTWTTPAGKHLSLKKTLPANQWLHLSMKADLASGQFRVLLDDEEVSADNMRLKEDQRYNALVLMPGGDSGSDCCVDNVKIMVTNPAAGQDAQGVSYEQQDKSARPDSRPTAQPKIDKEAANILSPQRSE